MKTFLLVIVLGLSPQQDATGEQHVAVIVPDMATCQTLRSAFVYAVEIVGNEAKNTPVNGEFVDPFVEFDEPEPDVRSPLEVLDVRCEVHDG